MRKISIDAEVAYTNAVKLVFEEKSETYDQFLKLLNNFRADRIDAGYANARVNTLFKGHRKLIFGFSNLFMPYDYEIKLPLDEQQLCHDDESLFIKLVEDIFVDKRGKFEEFVEVRKDFLAKRIDKRSFHARMKEVFIGHANLMLGFNEFLPKRSRIILRFEGDYYKCGKRKKRVAMEYQLPWDVLENISKRLDFDDLFELSGVCKDWRAFYKIYWRNFLTSQEPLLVQMFFDTWKSFSFISIADQKVYHSKGVNHFASLCYSGSSSGYIIMTGDNNNFVLINPFTKRKKVIMTSTFEVKQSNFAYHVLLAFVKGSEEFVLVVLCKSSDSLYVYQSQNLGWTTYSTMGNPWKVVDFTILNNTIYVLCNKCDKVNIGILNLNSANIKFLELKSTLEILTRMHDERLVTCDGQLLLCLFGPLTTFKVYKIDFSNMNFVKLESLGDNALFYAFGRNCYALSNPYRWGYESNTVYGINHVSTKWRVHFSYKCSMCNSTKLPRCLMHHKYIDMDDKRPYLLDWCFKPPYEIDYSLVD